MKYLKLFLLFFLLIPLAVTAQTTSDTLTSSVEKYHFNHNYNYMKDTLAKLPFHADSLLRHAVRHVGTVYLPNGKEPGGFDCTGFTFYNFKRFGIYLPYYAYEQAEVGRQIPVAEAKRGDLVLFKGHDLAVDKAGHVGIVADVTAGRIHFIHASTSHGVRYDFADGPYYKERFIMIRRVVE